MAWDVDFYAGLTQRPYDPDPGTLGTISREAFTERYDSVGGTFTCPKISLPTDPETTMQCPAPHVPLGVDVAALTELIFELDDLTPRPTWISLHVFAPVICEPYTNGCAANGDGCGPVVNTSPVMTLDVSNGFASNADDPVAAPEEYPAVGGMGPIMSVWARPDSGGYPGHPANPASALLWPYDELAATVLTWHPSDGTEVHRLTSADAYGLQLVARPFIEFDWELEPQDLLLVV